MKAPWQARRILVVAAVVITAWFVCLPAPAQTFVVTNDNNESVNTTTIYEAGSGPSLARKHNVKTGGIGGSSIYIGSVMQAIVPQSGGITCIFVSNGRANTTAKPKVYASITAIEYDSASGTFTDLGPYFGSTADKTTTGIIGVSPVAASPDGNYLYVGFPAANNIATFTIAPGCALTFGLDVAAKGIINNGAVIAMATGVAYPPNGPILAVAYSDGTIQSFNIAIGVPGSNGDAQPSQLFEDYGSVPESVVITQDGHFVVFGDDPGERYHTDVESYSTATGQLGPAHQYHGGTGSFGSPNGSSNILLSPNEGWLYVSNNDSGQVTALHFDTTTGSFNAGCTSGALKGFEDLWYFTAGIAARGTAGTGSVLYVAEDAVGTGDNGIGIVSFDAANCSPSSTTNAFTESTDSPAPDPSAGSLASLSTFTP